MTVEAVDPDGVIITTEGFGNNHIDFASHHEQVGMRGIPVVGMSFCAVQGALVVGNEYMTHMVDNNKSKQGIENEILENNCLAPEDLNIKIPLEDNEQVLEKSKKRAEIYEKGL